MNKLVFLIFTVFLINSAFAKIIVPNKMVYCGHNLTFSNSAKSKIQGFVDKITENDLYFYRMVEKAGIYLPIIQDALAFMGVPEDIKYIAIQESGLRGDAVSSSNAVGFWQLKDFTALEVGLTINGYVDERKHLYRSSIGASRYFYKNYQKYQNWLYAITAYYTGMTGALPYINNYNVGSTNMYVDDNVHWYVLKAIAHKIAYQNYLDVYSNPKEWLMPLHTQNETSVLKLAEKNGLKVSELKLYNPWILYNSLPQNSTFSYYIPIKEKPFACVSDPCQKVFSKPISTLAGKYYKSIPVDKIKTDTLLIAKVDTVKPKIITPDSSQKLITQVDPQKELPAFVYKTPNYIKQNIETDPFFKKEFIVYDKKFTLNQLAKKYNKKAIKLRVWNNINPGDEPKLGQIIYIIPPHKAHIHVVGKYETLDDVAIFHQKDIHKLLELNDLDVDSLNLYERQKIYLKEFKPSDEKTILFSLQRFMEMEDLFIEYEVQLGDTIYNIAKKFNVSIETLKEWNTMTSMELQLGQKLKVLENQ